MVEGTRQFGLTGVSYPDATDYNCICTPVNTREGRGDRASNEKEPLLLV